MSVWAHHGQASEYEALKQIVAAFNAAHAGENLRVELTQFPDGQYADKVAIASAAERLPDVLEIDGPFVGPWAAEGVLAPLDEHVSAELRRDFLPTIIAQGTYDDQLYALGAFESALVVYYNRDIIERAGLSPPTGAAGAWTWDEFVAALRKTQAHAALPLSLHLDDPGDEWMTYAFAPLLWSNGGALIDVDGGRIDGVLNSTANVSALQRWQALFSEGLAEVSSPMPSPFTGGEVAFDWTGHWMLPTFEQTPGLRFGVMPLPHMGDAPATSAGSWCWGIARDCETPSDAWKFIAWVTDVEHGVLPMTAANGAVPSRRSALDSLPEYQTMPRKLFREQLEHTARARPRTAVYLALTSSFARALRDVALGADVRGSLDHAARSVQFDLDRRPRARARGSDGVARREDSVQSVVQHGEVAR